jgi:HEPN domain-containing protein
LSEYEEWLSKAEDDFDDAKYNIEGGRDSPAALFLQQAVEKALKAMIVKSDEEVSHTHNLLELAETAGLPDEKTDYFARLNTMYTGVRYPGEDVGEVENLEEIADHVKEVIEWTKKQLKE